jgi:hypothetical protein
MWCENKPDFLQSINEIVGFEELEMARSTARIEWQDRVES